MTESIHRDPSAAARRRRDAAEAGHTLLIVLLIATIMILGTTVAAKVWTSVVKRDKEEELIFRGKQYEMALYLYRKQRGTLPNDLKQLEERGLKQETVLRQLYKDPITGGDFGLVFMGPNGQPIPDEPIEADDPLGLDEDKPGGAPKAGSSEFGAPPVGAAAASGRGASTGPNRDIQPSAFGTPTTVGGGLPILGVHSKSKDYAQGPARMNDLERYNQWLFLVTAISGGGQQIVLPGAGGTRGRGAGNPTGGTFGNPSGGTFGNPAGGSFGNPSGGTFGNPPGGRGSGNPSGGRPPSGAGRGGGRP